MLISSDANETRVAIIEDDVLVEFYVERAKRSVVGNVYLGVVRDVLPGMEAAFVDIGLEKNAFLYVDEVVTPEDVETPKRDISDLLKPGQTVMVQVVRDPMGTKGARVTTEISLPGRFLVLMPFTPSFGVSKKLPDAERDRLHSLVEPLLPGDMGLIVRTAAAGVARKDLEADLEFLLRLWRRVKHQAQDGLPPEILYTEMDLALRMVRDVFSDSFARLVVSDKTLLEKVTAFLKRSSPELVKRVQLHREEVTLFDYFGLQPQLEAAMRRVVPLPSGGHLSIDRTEALTAIDVNTGKYVGRKNLEDTLLRTNLEAAQEAVRQMRLRDLGGIIVIDFIDMEEAASRDAVMRRFNESLERDRTRTRVMDMSRLGLVEMTRKNVTDGFWGVLTETCPTCLGQGRVLSDTTLRIHTERSLRELLRHGRADAYLVGLHPEAYAQVMAPGSNVIAALRAETGKLLVLQELEDCERTEVRLLIEGRPGTRMPR